MSYPRVPGARPSSRLSERKRMCARIASGRIVLDAASAAERSEGLNSCEKEGLISNKETMVNKVTVSVRMA